MWLFRLFYKSRYYNNVLFINFFNIVRQGFKSRLSKAPKLYWNHFLEKINICLFSFCLILVVLKLPLSFGKISSRGHNYIILLDTSESMKGEKFDLMIKTATEYIEGTCMIYILSAIKTRHNFITDTTNNNFIPPIYWYIFYIED